MLISATENPTKTATRKRNNNKERYNRGYKFFGQRL